MIKVLIGPADKFHIDGLKIYDDESLGFDYQEHLIRRCFEENGSDANVYLIYQDHIKSVEFILETMRKERKAYPKLKERIALT